jgi:flagellar protein FliO/FliZ
MQSLATFFEDNKPLAYAAVVAAIIVLVFVVLLLYRLLFGRRLRAATNGRARQPRLGIVDAYDLDRQRQLVLVRRDNVEHLIMIGGPTDVVVESSIVRTQSAGTAREKDGAGPMVGGFAPAPSLAASPAPAALTAQPPAAVLPPAGSRTEPSIAARSEPVLASREDGPATGRTEPALGLATPMPSPTVDRGSPDRGGTRPIAVPDPSAPATPPSGPSEPPPARSLPPRPSSLPPRPVTTPSAAPQGSANPPPDRPAGARPALPPRPPVQRTPLPPRPSLASTLPPRPPRPPLPNRAEPPRPDPSAAPAQGQDGSGPQRPATEVPSSGPAVDVGPRAPRGPEPSVTAPRPDAAPPAAPPKNVEMIESLEEEMAKLLGRPAPRRDG